MAQPSVRYSDFGLDFTPSPDTGNISIKNNASAIKQSLSNLMMIAFGEKPFHPEIGFGLRNYLFENITPIVISSMRRHIEEIITSYEPRVNIISIDFSDNIDSNELGISIYFTAINLENPIRLEFIVQRVR
jgi:phage baseplate assembly protein W